MVKALETSPSMVLKRGKLQYLVDKFHLKFQKGENSFKAKCEMCSVEIQGTLMVSKNGNAYNISSKGQFHHDQKRELHLLCGKCHIRLHEWGLIQRWLDKIGKTVNELPDCRGLKAWRRFLPWG